MTAPTNQALIDFVLAEARLLDELRFDDWLEQSAATTIWAWQQHY